MGYNNSVVVWLGLTILYVMNMMILEYVARGRGVTPNSL